MEIRIIEQMEYFLSLMSLQTWISSYVFCNCWNKSCNVTAAFCWAEKNWNAISFKTFKSSRPEVFLRKGVLKICSKFSGEHPSPINLLHIFGAIFPKNTSGGLLLNFFYLENRCFFLNILKFCVFGEFTNFKTSGVIDITAH